MPGPRPRPEPGPLAARRAPPFSSSLALSPQGQGIFLAAPLFPWGYTMNYTSSLSVLRLYPKFIQPSFLSLLLLFVVPPALGYFFSEIWSFFESCRSSFGCRCLGALCFGYV